MLRHLLEHFTGLLLDPLAVGDCLYIKPGIRQNLGEFRVQRMCVLEQSSIVVLDFVARDAEEPSSKRGRAAEASQVLPCGHEYILDQIVHEVLPWVQAAADERVDSVGVSFYKLCGCFTVFPQNRGHQRKIVHTRLTG